MDKYDVVIAGGGMVGALLANLLAGQQLSVLVVEAYDVSQFKFSATPNLRTSAFSVSSVALLKSVDAWQHISPERRAPYSGLHTWENEAQSLSFAAADVGADYLGQILENNLVQNALWQGFASRDIKVRCPAAVKSAELVVHGGDADQSQIEITLDNGEQVIASLLVGADGANSKVRQMAGIGTQGWQYQQQCMAITVQMQARHAPVTWQAFHPSGPRAYLPLYGNYASLIWYDSAETITKLKALSNDQLTAQIKAHFPARLGDFKLLEKASFPLTRMHAQSYYAGHTVLVGDAAHSINPLAGQGVNLGFKDAAKLAQCLGEALKQGKPLYDGQVLKGYQQARYKHNLLMMSMMDACYWGFSNDNKPLSLLRNMALSLADKAGPLKRQILKYAMG